MKLRTLLLGLAALFIAFNAAFFSVTGLAKLFAGASLSVILMASSLELAKLIVAGYLYNYWEKINKGFRIYLLGATLVLVLITSLGIYGFLTAAFQDTFKLYSVTSKEKTFLQQKEKFWEDDVIRYDKELERISENISTLSSAKTQQIQYTDKNGKTQSSVSTTELRAAQSRIVIEEQNRKEVQSKRQIAADSLQSIQLQILEIDTNVEVGSELGPLEYLSGLLGKPMDVIINWFILIIIFVFDPLAIALVVAFNNAMKVDKGEEDKKKVIRKRELYGDDLSEKGMDVIIDDAGISNDKEKQRELIKEIIQADEKDGLYDDWDVTLMDGLEDKPYILSSIDGDVFFETIKEDSDPNEVLKEAFNKHLAKKYKKELDLDGDGVVSDGELSADKDGDGVISEEEYREWYEGGGWKAPYKDGPYYTNPRFDWSKRDRWINDRKAIEYWISYQGGNQNAVEQYKKEIYPTDFTSKTY
jgi:hypothetical protein